MKLYYRSIYVGNYDICAVGTTPQKCINAIVRKYHQQFGSFAENGFKSKSEWIEWHGLEIESCDEIELDKAWIR